MPSIAAFIQGLLSEDMYATGMIEKMDERISELNTGQLRLLVRFCETKVPGLTNKTVLGAYTKLLRTATVETDKRYEEEVRGERERLRQLKASHAGVNAKAWDTSHASLDRELAKFQKFLKRKARRVAEEEVIQEEMEKLQSQLLDLPARRVDADNKRRFWWAIGATLIVIVGPILFLSLFSVGAWVAFGSFLGLCVLAAVCWFVGMVRGMMAVPTLDDDVIERETRKRAKDKLNEYRAEVRQNYEATEQIFAADLKWRDDWLEDRKKERRKERRTARQDPPGNGGVRTSPTEGQPLDLLSEDSGAVGDGGGGGINSRPAPAGVAVDLGGGGVHSRLLPAGAADGVEEGGINSRLPPAVTGQAEAGSLAEEGVGKGLAVSGTGEAIGQKKSELVSSTGGAIERKHGEVAPNASLLLSGQDLGLRGEEREHAGSPPDETRGPCQGSCLVENIKGSGDDFVTEEGQPSVRTEAAGQQPSLGRGVQPGEAVGGAAVVFRGVETGEAAV